MRTVLAIDGMSCGHCVSAVKQALADVPGVTVQSVEIGSATVETGDPAPIDAMKLAVEDAGYFAEVQG
jgi:copper chaperone